MNTIDRYIARTFLSSYLILLLIGIGLYIASDVIVNLDEYTEEGMTAANALTKIVDYHGYRLPLYFQQLGGVMMAIAAGFTFAILLRSNELTPLIASGVPLQRLLVPVMLCSIALVGLWLANTELLIPRFAGQIARRIGDLDDVGAQAVRCVRDDRNAILIADELHSRQGFVRGAYIIEPDDQRKPQRLIRADVARYDAAQKTWALERGERLALEGAFESGELGSPIRWESTQAYSFTLSPSEILLRQSAQWSDLMSIRQMNEVLAARNLPNLPSVARSRDIRFVSPLIIWILILLATPFFLTRQPENVIAAGGKALLLAGACFGFTFLAHSLPTDSEYSRLAVAIPVLLFGPIAMLYVANLKS